MNKKQSVEKELNEIVDSTIDLSFPMLANKKNKEKRIIEEKERIEESIEDVIQAYDLNISINSQKKEIWKESEGEASKEFDTLPEKLQFNSFYFQEVMHLYAEKLSDIVLKAL